MSFVVLAFSNQVCETTISGVNNIEEIGRVPSNYSSRWLNVVFGLNGILCACEPAWKAREWKH